MSTPAPAAVSSSSRRRKATRKTQPNKVPNPAACPAPKVCHAASADDAAHHAPTPEARKAQTGEPAPSVVIPTPEGESAPQTTLDSKSITPDTRPEKSAALLQEGSSKRKKKSISQDTKPEKSIVLPQGGSSKGKTAAASDENVLAAPKPKNKKARASSPPPSATEASVETADVPWAPLDPSASTSNTTSNKNPSQRKKGGNKVFKSDPNKKLPEIHAPVQDDPSPVCVTVRAPASVSSTTFDPKSILPEIKSTKKLPTLRESSSSGKKATQQSTVFRCIDGALRTTDPNESVSEGDIPVPIFDQYISSPDTEATSKTDRDSKEQFKAFGIEAFPTRALTLDICYDFVSFNRWCSHGSKCVRVHPLDKRAFLPTVMKERAQYERMKAAAGNSDSRSTENQLSSTSHVKAASTHETTQETIRVKLPLPESHSASPEPATSISRHQRSMTPVPVASSSNDVHNWDTIVGLHPRQRSRSSSPSAKSERLSRPLSPSDPRMWEPHSDESSWSEWNETDADRKAFRKNLEQRMKEGTFMIAKAPGDVESPKLWFTTLPDEDVQPKIKHPRPRNSERCRRWLRNECSLGYDCKYIHEDLEYDDDDPPDMPVQQPVRGPEYYTAVLHEHMRMKVSAGFAVEDVSTGFESNIIFIANLPPAILDPALKRLLDPFGEIIEIRRPPSHSQSQPSLSVRVEYSKSVDAYNAFAALHGTRHFNRKLELRMAVETRRNGSLIKDTVVRIDWDYAHRTVYMGYASEVLAEEAAAKARHVLYDGQYQTAAAVFIGIPAVGKVTVKFDFLPPNVTQEGMKVFGDHQGMVTAWPSYDCTIQDNINGITKLCKQFQSTMTDLDFRSAPYKAGKMRAWAYFSSPKDAEAAALNLNGRKPPYIGRTWLTAKHIKMISFSLGLQRYQKVSRDVRTLAEEIWHQGPGYSLSVINKNTYVTLRLCGENYRVLGRLKSEVERTLNGEPVLIDGKVAWDDFFRWPNGANFLHELEFQHPGVTIERDTLRRTIRVFGPPGNRAWARQRIIGQIKKMGLQKWHKITLDSLLATALSTGPLDVLKKKFGWDNFELDHWYHVLRVRGNEEMLTLVSDEVNALRKRLPYSSPLKKALRYECPVCLNEASPPVHLACGHTFCLGCLKRYLLAAVDHKFFPLKCLGGEGKCEERISLALAKQLLPPDSFNAVVEAAFSAHVQTHPNEFHFCPTPDCPQIYRSAKEGVFIQCPSCLVRICPNCHLDAHDGLSCAEAGSGDDLFQEWAGKHGVKQCPGCKIGIEKDEGCNHMVCTMCKTHICWVCSQTFPNGDGIYKHMHEVHGGIGLAEDLGYV